MRFQMPNFPCDFELPDEWLAAADMVCFTPTTTAYRSTAAAVLVPLATIEPPYRLVTHQKDWRGFNRDRLVYVFKGIVAGAEIEPVPLFKLPVTDFPHTPYRYRVLNEYHRFFASVAAGFEDLPATIS